MQNQTIMPVTDPKSNTPDPKLTKVVTPKTDLQNWTGAVNDQFEFGKNAYLEAIPDLSYSIGASKAIGGLQGRAAMDQYMLSNNLAQRRGQFDGMEDKYAKMAFDTNSEANKERVAGQATADVAQQFGNMRDQAVRNATRSGVNPASGRFAALQNQTGIAQAGAQAQAANKARQDLDVLADSRQRTAIGFGQPLTGQAMNAAQLAGGLGNYAAASAAQPLSQRLNFAGGVSNLYGNAVNGYQGLWQSQNLTASQLANINAQNAQNEANEDNAFFSTLGTVAGGLLTAPETSVVGGWLKGL